MKQRTLHEIIAEMPIVGFMQARRQVKSSAKKHENFVTSMQCSRELKDAASEICLANNTTASGFMRECLMYLVSEYTGIEIGSDEWLETYGNVIGVGEYL